MQTAWKGVLDLKPPRNKKLLASLTGDVADRKSSVKVGGRKLRLALVCHTGVQEGGQLLVPCDRIRIRMASGQALKTASQIPREGEKSCREEEVS